MYWAIVVLREGEVLGTLAVSDGSTFYAPEQNVLTFCNGYVARSDAAGYDEIQTFMGETKTMRKMQGGDQLVLVAKASAALTSEFAGQVQWFNKS